MPLTSNASFFNGTTDFSRNRRSIAHEFYSWAVAPGGHTAWVVSPLKPIYVDVNGGSGYVSGVRTDVNALQISACRVPVNARRVRGHVSGIRGHVNGVRGYVSGVPVNVGGVPIVVSGVPIDVNGFPTNVSGVPGTYFIFLFY